MLDGIVSIQFAMQFQQMIQQYVVVMAHAMHPILAFVIQDGMRLL